MKPRWASSGRFERVLGARYPFGVSRRLRAGASIAGKPKISSTVLFIATLNDSSSEDAFAGPQGELLLKAFVQGLNWPREDIELIFLHNSQAEQKKSVDKAYRQTIWQGLNQSIKTRQPRAVVALGEEVASLLDMPLQPLKTAFEKRLNERDGICFLSTADLGEVVRAPEIKRIFWNDLKGFSIRLKK